MKKAIFAVFGTIILGAVGSGLWDLVLSDIILWIGEAVLTLFSRISAGYLDLLYKDVGKGPLYPLVREPLVVVFSFLVALPAVFVLITWTKLKKLKQQIGDDKSEKPEISPEDKLKTVDRFFKIGVLPYFCVVTVFFILQVWQALYTHSASSYLERSLDIVAPHIAAHELQVLVARYRSIDSASEFSKLKIALETIASENNAKLPEFEPI